jgi:two-component system, chemotaxis family, sensor kinase CheA
MDTHQEAFREEAYELLAELESALLELEEIPDDTELIGRIFRAMHTIKGSGAMFGFDDIAAFTHEVETAFDLVREGKVVVNQDLINVTLEARDQIMTMLRATEGGEAADDDHSQAIIASLKALISGEEDQEGQENEGESSIFDADAFPAPPQQETTWRIHFQPALDIFSNGTNPLLLLNELCDLGECNVVAHPDAIPELASYDPEACYTSWDIILTTNHDLNDIKDVFIFVEDDCELEIQCIGDEATLTDEEATPRKLGEILVDRGDISSEDLDKTLGTQKRIGELLTDTTEVKDTDIVAALAEQEHVKRMQQNKQKKIVSSSIRVDALKLDSLVDLVGELVTVQARLSQKAATQNDQDLLAIAEEVGRLTDELRDNTMSIRMLPIGTTFNKFRRLVRDLSNDLGKTIVLTTDGEETELDKTVIDQLNDPLVHLIRNSIDHGIEIPEARETAGKSPEGRIHLSARHSGGYVLIEIRDDGAGLDPEVLRTKAVNKGLLAADANPSEHEIFDFLFAPGFSTAETVTDVSGRGVGMDVVKKGIENLRGSIEICSQLGSGTSIILKLPLTLAIIDGLLVKIGTDHYVMPLAAVEECIELSREETIRARTRNMMAFRGKALSYLNLRQGFNIQGEPPVTEKVVITEVNGVNVGLAVDQVIGQHQTVIKSLSEVYRGVRGFSGATILGDGTVALILDVNMLVQSLAPVPRRERCERGGR